MHILVADDDALLRQLLTEFLQEHGHTVDVAKDGPEALERLRTGAYQVAFLDFMMPGLSGMEVLRAAHDAVPDTACVMMTGYTSVTTAVEAIKAGASDFVAKPLEPDALDRVLENVKTAAQAREARGVRPAEKPSPTQSEVRAAFLTDRAGLLLASRVVPEERMVDGDLFGATLDVIQNFMRTSFPALQGRWLKSIRQGNCTLVLEPGDEALLTVLVRGQETEALHRRMRNLLRDFEDRNRGRMQSGLVHMEDIRGADELLTRLVARGRPHTARPPRGSDP